MAESLRLNDGRRSMEHAAQQDVAASIMASKGPWAALVIDDDAGVRQSLRLCLEAAGARVLGVATGRAALEALDRGRFDVVFLDLWLGADAGMELLPEILARQPDVGIIVVTAYASIESAVTVRVQVHAGRPLAFTCVARSWSCTAPTSCAVPLR